MRKHEFTASLGISSSASFKGRIEAFAALASMNSLHPWVFQAVPVFKGRIEEFAALDRFPPFDVSDVLARFLFRRI